MRLVLGLLLGALLAGCATVPPPQWAEQSLPKPEVAPVARLQQVLAEHDFHGEALYSPDAVTTHRAAHPDFADGAAWPWASVTKQVVATLILQEVAEGTFALDDPVGAFLPRLATSAVTWRELLQHRSPLPNPDDTERDSAGWPQFYRMSAPSPLAFCMTGLRDRPAQGYRYNNCDYIVAGAALERATGLETGALIQERIGKRAGWTDTRLFGGDEMRDFVSHDPAFSTALARFGASGALVGPLADMVRFDRALLDGTLLDEAARRTLWQGDPALGYMALGQWSFEAALEGCADPVRIIERRGAIGPIQVRNVILPATGQILIMATDRAEGTFDFGEVWQGTGLTHDALAAIACGGGA